MGLKHLACLLAGIALCTTSRAQHYFYDDGYYDAPFLLEAGLKVGTMNCLTDLGGHTGIGQKGLKDVNWNCFRPCTAAFIAGEWANFISARLELVMGSVRNADSLLKNSGGIEGYRFVRNLSFQSPIRELSLRFQIRPLELLPSIEGMSTTWSPFLFVGVGQFHFDPYVQLNGRKVHLRQLHLEGQGFREYPERKTYGQNTWCFPVGGGIQFEPSARFRLHMTVDYRVLRTDYLDDVSTTYVDPELFAKYLTPENAQLARELADRRIILPNGRTNLGGEQRGNSKHNDAYFSFDISMGWVFGREKR